MASLFSAMHAEWVKLTTVRATRWLLGIALVAGWAIEVLIVLLSRNLEVNASDSALLALGPFTGIPGIPGLAILISVVVGVLSVTTETRYNTLRTAFLATSNRLILLVAKTVVVAGVCAVAFLVGGIGSTLIYWVFGSSEFEVLGSGAARYVTLPIGTALMAVLGVAAGMAIRNGAGAITLLLAYIFVVESVVSAVPQTRDAAPYLPMSNVFNLLGQLNPPDPWPIAVSLAYLILVFGALWGAAAAIMVGRDA